MLRTLFIVLLLATSLQATAADTAPAPGSDWPQFRGPRASGVDASHALPTEWDVESGKNIRWQAAIPGLAHACPIVAGDRIYIATAIGEGEPELKVGLYGDIKAAADTGKQQWRLIALSRETGKILWNELALEAAPRVKRHTKASHCNSTPATDGQFIVAIFGSEGLFCFDKDGKLRWKKDLGPMDSGFFRIASAQWGFASSPIIHEGKVIVLCDVQDKSFLAAFDLKTGDELWRASRSDVPTWGCPTVVDIGGRKQIVVNGWRHSGGYAIEDGKELWKLKGGGDIPVPTPIVAQDLIVLTSSHGGPRPIRAIKPDAAGDITPATADALTAGIAWVQPKLGTYMQTPIAVGKLLFACTDNGVLSCLDAATGQVHYTERLGVTQGYTASPVSDGRHVFFAGENGKVIVVPATEKFAITATNDVRDICMATPAISGGMLLIRTKSKLIAVGGK